MRLREYSLLILTVLAMSHSAQASPWYPIDTGRIWVYSDADGGSPSAAVEDPVSFAGSLVQPLHWNSGSREYLSLDESGRVLFHGVTFPDDSYVVFDPPTLRMESGLTVGLEWETVTSAIQYTVDGVEVRREQARSAFMVIAVGPVTVAAGTFQAAEVLRIEETGYVPDYSFRDTYAEDVGWILRTDENGSSVLFELEAYGEGGVRTEVASWGAVKSLFR